VKKRYEIQGNFWEQAGKVGYGKAIFSNSIVEKHVNTKQWESAIETANLLGLNKDSKVIELGCGDGDFAINYLSSYYKTVDAFDISCSAIERARSLSQAENVNFIVKNMTQYEYAENAFWDGAFLLVFLHHVKEYTPKIISSLSKVCPKVIVLEPNGDNLIRKGFELLPKYRRSGEDSFYLKKLLLIFNSFGYSNVVKRRITLMPPFLPEILFKPLETLESLIEPRTFLNRLCSTYVLGFIHTL